MLHLFMKGGPLMWPLLVVSLIALTTVIERVLASLRERRGRAPEDVRVMLQELGDANIPGAIEVGEVSTDFSARCLAAGLKSSDASFASAYQHQAARELRQLSRGLPILDTTITLAPLLGLLGTVTGMIHAFGLMGASEMDAPAAITGGIAEALIATAFGLIIASLSLVPFNWLNARIENAQHELQDLGYPGGTLGDGGVGAGTGAGPFEIARALRLGAHIKEIAMQIALPSPRRKARIEIIPLIDIIFFLLATFVLVSMSMIKNQGVPVRLPVAASSAALSRGETLILRVTREGTVFIDKQQAALDTLAGPLEAFQKSQPDPKVIIQGDREAAYGQVVSVLDAVRKAGITKVAVQTTKQGS